MPGACGGARRHAAEPALVELLADDVRQPEGERDRVRALLDRRRVVDRERLERLDQVAAVQVEQHVGRLDHLVEDRAGKNVGVRAVVRPREAAVQVLAVLGDDERRPLPKRLHAHDRHRGDRPGELARVELVHERRHGGDRRVLAAVDAADQRDVRPVARAARLVRRMLETAEGERAPLDHLDAHHLAFNRPMQERRTSPVELLWDLVFVFAITQMTTLIAHDLTWARLRAKA